MEELRKHEMLIELLNTGVRKICQETYGGNRIAIGIYDFDQWPTITAQNLKHTGSWVGHAGVEWQGLVAPAVPTKAEFQRGQWCAYIKGETYIAGPRALSLAQSSGKAVSTATMDRFRLINGPRGSGITVSEWQDEQRLVKHSLTFKLDESEQHTSSLLFEGYLPIKVRYNITRKINVTLVFQDSHSTSIQTDYFALDLVYTPHHAITRVPGESAHVLAPNA